MISVLEPLQNEGIFLQADYGSLSFLIPRSFWSGSRYLPDARVPVLDLDGWLVQTFGCEAGRFPLVLLASTSSWAKKTRSIWGHLVPTLVGFRVSVEPRLVGLEASEFRSFGSSLTEVLQKQGVIGCRFPSEHMVSLFLDPERLVPTLFHQGRP